MTKRTLIFLVLSILYHAVSAQTSTDTLAIARAKANAVKLYNSYIQGQAGVYTGSEYVEPKRKDDNHPFWKVDDWMWGSVVYNEQLFHRVPFLYDILSDELVTEHYATGKEIVLVREKVSRFTIDGSVFIYMKKEAGLPVAGFYEEGYNGPAAVLARYEKMFDEKIDSQGITFYYTPKTRFYIRKGEAFSRVRNKRDVLRLFEDKKGQVRSWISKNKIVFSKSNASSFVEVAKYYDSI